MEAQDEKGVEIHRLTYSQILAKRVIVPFRVLNN